jgi:hypothetical protein
LAKKKRRLPLTRGIATRTTLMTSPSSRGLRERGRRCRLSRRPADTPA